MMKRLVWAFKRTKNPIKLLEWLVAKVHTAAAAKQETGSSLKDWGGGRGIIGFFQLQTIVIILAFSSD